MKARFQCVRQQAECASAASEITQVPNGPGFSLTRRAYPAAPTPLARPQYYRSISRAMTSCWIWLVPS